jgi:hypothetical protein
MRVVPVENQNHMKLRLLFYGYPSARGLSIPILMIPPAVSDHDPRLEMANQYVQQLAAQKFELSATPAPAAQPIRPEQPAAGWRPKPDIDLTYHAMAIIPKERDVLSRASTFS